jgi:hypothetical protein
MNIRRILGIVVVIAGIALIIISQYIKTQVAEGNLQISSAQEKVNQGNKLFSLSPYSKPIGQQMTGAAQKKINAGQEQVAYYTQLADQMQIGGIALIVIGTVIILIPRKSKR